MTRPVLRDYQRPLVDALVCASDGTLIVLPTGGGKTVVMGAAVRAMVDRGERVTIMAHRVELLTQVRDRLAAWGLDVGVRGGGSRCADPLTRPVLAMGVGSWSAVRPGTRAPRGGVVIIDEAHHATASTYSAAIDAIKPRVVLGLTATPRRLDGSGLRSAGFSRMVVGPHPYQLVSSGALVPCVLHTTHASDAYTGRTARGDFVQSEAAERMVTLAGDTLGHVQQIVQHGPCAVFCVRIDHATAVSKRCRDAGLRAAVIHSELAPAERARVMGDLRSGQLDVITSVDMLGEGVDVPELAGVVMARPTQSLVVYMQQIGRALRPAPGKSQAIVVDQVGNYHRHGHPLAPRRWSLDGVTHQQRDTQQRDTSATETASGSVVIAELDVALQQIDAPVYVAAATDPAADVAPEAPAVDREAELATACARRLQQLLDAQPRDSQQVDGSVWAGVVWALGGASVTHAGSQPGWLARADIDDAARTQLVDAIQQVVRRRGVAVAADAVRGWLLTRRRRVPVYGPASCDDARELERRRSRPTSPALAALVAAVDADSPSLAQVALRRLRREGRWSAVHGCEQADADLLVDACRLAGHRPGAAWYLAGQSDGAQPSRCMMTPYGATHSNRSTVS